MYSWSHNAGLNNPVADNLAAGSYTVTITDANDSIASITAEVSQNAALSVSAVITPVSCTNGSDGAINITVTGGKADSGYEYFWTTLNGSGINPLVQDQSSLTDGTYTVEVKDVNNCADTADFVVIEPQPFNYTGTDITTIVKPIVPSGRFGAIDLAVAGGNAPYNFAWTGPNGFSATSENIANLDSAGLYNLVITDSKSCTSDTSFTVIDNFSFVAEIRTKSNVTCFGYNDGTATVKVFNGTAPFSYQWSDGPVLVDSVRTGMPPGNYIVTVTDGALKTARAYVTITGPATALTVVLNPDNLHCNGDNSGVVDLTASGGSLPYTFLWSNGYTGEDLVNVAADTYTVTVTDDFNCTVQETKEVTEPAPIGLNITETSSILCHGDLSAIAIANATGGTPPGTFSYQWDDPGTQTTQTAYELGAGTYHVTVTDSNGCFKTDQVTIIEPAALTVTAILNNPTCPGLSDGSIIPTPAGGTGSGYEYIWSNNIYQRFNTDIPAGTYILTLNDANNCVRSDTFALVNPDTVKINSVDITDVSCLGKTDGALNINATGGSGSLSYSTDNGVNFVATPAFAPLAGGDYIVVVKDCQQLSGSCLPGVHNHYRYGEY